MVTALHPLTDIAEAIGVAQGVGNVDLPVAISFTVETNGRLPSGAPLARSITEVDEAVGPDI